MRIGGPTKKKFVILFFLRYSNETDFWVQWIVQTKR